MAAMSELLQALYEGRRADAAALLEADPSPVLDIFEAAAVGDGARVAELLRADGGLATAWTDDGFTALHLACFFGTPAVVLALVEAGADLNVASRNPMGVRPINSAAAGGRPLDSVRVLLDRGADVDGRQASGHTALDEAHVRNDQALIDLLVARGAARSH
jgi:ankyrin repeat protein